MDERSLFIDFWTNESKTTRNVLARIPEGSDYRPDPKSRTARLAPAAVCALFAFAAPMFAGETVATPDPWAPVRFLVGEWNGSAEGEPGSGVVTRRYDFVLSERYIEERNVSSYAPREADKPGEVHEHRSFLSYDRTRAVLILRQFHEEGFVNLYALSAVASTPTKLVFESVGFENFDNAWKARETYEIVSADEFTETFELAPPGKPFEVYSRNRFRRSAAAPGSPAIFDEVLAKSVGADEHGMRKYVLVILKSSATPVPAGPERDEMFRGHFANMERLSAEGKLVLAGPLDGVDGWRGLFVLAVATIDEAKPLVATDPVVLKGEMVPEFRTFFSSAAIQLIPEMHKKVAKKSL